MDVTVWVGAGALLVSVISLGFSLRSSPARVRRSLQHTLDALKVLETDVSAIRASWMAYREAIDGVLEEITHTEERTDRHRRSVKQVEKREAAKADSNGAEPDPHMALILAAREQGAPV